LRTVVAPDASGFAVGDGAAAMGFAGLGAAV
jgi:hypothetical protein